MARNIGSTPKSRKNLTGLWLALAFGAGLTVGLICRGGFGCNNGNTINHYHWTEDDFPIPDVGTGEPESCECCPEEKTDGEQETGGEQEENSSEE